MPLREISAQHVPARPQTIDESVDAVAFRELAADIVISISSWYAIFRHVLGMKCMAAKFVPKYLSNLADRTWPPIPKQKKKKKIKAASLENLKTTSNGNYFEGNKIIFKKNQMFFFFEHTSHIYVDMFDASP